MILSGVTFTNGRLHETGQRGQDVNRGVDTLVVQLTVNENLSLGNITSQVRNRVRDIYNEGSVS